MANYSELRRLVERNLGRALKDALDAKTPMAMVRDLERLATLARAFSLDIEGLAEKGELQ